MVRTKQSAVFTKQGERKACAAWPPQKTAKKMVKQERFQLPVGVGSKSVPATGAKRRFKSGTVGGRVACCLAGCLAAGGGWRARWQSRACTHALARTARFDAGPDSPCCLGCATTVAAVPTAT